MEMFNDKPLSEDEAGTFTTMLMTSLSAEMLDQPTLPQAALQAMEVYLAGEFGLGARNLVTNVAQITGHGIRPIERVVSAWGAMAFVALNPKCETGWSRANLVRPGAVLDEDEAFACDWLIAVLNIDSCGATRLLSDFVEKRAKDRAEAASVLMHLSTGAEEMADTMLALASIEAGAACFLLTMNMLAHARGIPLPEYAEDGDE